EAVREGTFREDLLFRLNVVNLKIPPLRDRPADILELAQHFVKKYADANGVPLRPISAEARRVLSSNRWQGNVRELENTMHRAVLMAQGDEIGADAILSPDGDRLDLAKTGPGVAEGAGRGVRPRPHPLARGRPSRPRKDRTRRGARHLCSRTGDARPR